MGYSEENGYVPTDIETIMIAIMGNINSQFSTTYTYDTFVGTNFYKYFYALAQRLQENEVKTSEIFQKLQGYFDQVNAQISRPVVTPNGIVEKMELEGYVASVKPMIDADAGKVSICVDTDDGDHATGTITITSYANLVSGTDDSVGVAGVTFTAQVGAATLGTTTFQAATSNDATAASLALQINSHATASLSVKATSLLGVVTIRAVDGGTAGNSIALAYTDNDTNVGATKSGTALSGGTTNAAYAAVKTALCTLISQIVVAGAVTQGTQSEAVVLSNGQSFDFKFYLPNYITPLLKLTITLSDNNQVVVDTPTEIKAQLVANIAERYALGKDFEPQRYYSVIDAPWAASVLLEYSLDGGSNYLTAIYDSNFDDLFLCELANITLVEV